MQPVPDSVRAEVASLPTKSAKIRALDARGVARADIARCLGIRYQHVRNVLEYDLQKQSGGEDANERPDDEEVTEKIGSHPESVGAIPLEVDAQGRLQIPPEMRDAMLLGANGKVTARVENGELKIIAPRVALLRAREIGMKYKKPGESVVNEFLAGRRAMWGEE